MSKRAPAPPAGRSLPRAAAATVATFVLVALVVGCLEFSALWGLAGLFEVVPALLDGGLAVAGVAAVVIAAGAARRSWLVERRELGAALRPAEPATPAS